MFIKFQFNIFKGEKSIFHDHYLLGCIPTNVDHQECKISNIYEKYSWCN